ncbi:hypothetical protein [Paraburkholderia bonniea]|uniref:hypothetical protein n=1 Tax=Paraburkholderia bonniea TaxID=2152891 RepID=UPI001290A368|nr:hypothetical protein [Paraburkholderia bonniea]
MNKYILSLFVSTGLLISNASHAQLNLSQFGIGGHSAVSTETGGLSGLLQNYIGANQEVLNGQSNLASAMGLSSSVGQIQQAAGLLNGTPSVNQLSKIGGTQQSVSQALTQAFMSRGVSAPPVNKQAFTEGLAALGKGVSQYAGLSSGLGNITQMNPASLLQSGLNPQTAQAASYIAQSAPGQLKSLVVTLSQAVQFASNNGINVPAVATAALKGF